MIEWFSSFSAVEQVFLAMALIGGSIFVIQLVMMLLGGDTGSDGTVAGADFSSTDFLFKYFSLQSLTAFFMVAGLTGLYACSQGANIWVAIIVAIISGAIIAEAEGRRRGSYGGAVGYFTAHGDLDTCIVIRSALVENGIATVQAGAGVVLDSVPQSEADETRNKARAVLRAIATAHHAQETF